jgi:muramidase (phage lysozyme)
VSSLLISGKLHDCEIVCDWTPKSGHIYYYDEFEGAVHAGRLRTVIEERSKRWSRLPCADINKDGL